MIVIQTLLNGLAKINRITAFVGSSLAWILVALMISSILLQVFFRYVLNNALPWPEEAARAFMIWMMAMVAGSAYRGGSFVAIEMMQNFLPELFAKILKLLLLLMAAAVLYYLFTIGLDFFQRGFRTRAASFTLPRAWIYLAMPVCFGSMLLVNLELILSAFQQLLTDPPPSADH